MHRALLSLILLAGLAGCVSPADQCRLDATRELRILDGLIAETRENLARGYALERRFEVITETYLCFDRENRTMFCDHDRLVETERRLAIDPVSERRKLEGLETRRREEAGRAATALAACDARFPRS